MMSIRCKTAVKEVLKKFGLNFIMVELGEVEIMENLGTEQREQLGVSLMELGFELMDDKKALLVNRIKNILMETVQEMDGNNGSSLPRLLSESLNRDYASLSNLFSEVQGSTIEQFIITHKIERAKELMTYGGLSISEIAWKLNYSSLAHLSTQFKKVTGLPPSHFLRLRRPAPGLTEAPGAGNNKDQNHSPK
jgi:AraC-like DNA-binding protein